MTYYIGIIEKLKKFLRAKSVLGGYCELWREQLWAF
jgi:hypothetical protein